MNRTRRSSVAGREYRYKMYTRNPAAGASLRRLREKNSLTMRDVNARSKALAKAKRNPDYEISTTALIEIEKEGRVPHLFRIASLAMIYRVPLRRVLRLYGL